MSFKRRLLINEKVLSINVSISKGPSRGYFYICAVLIKRLSRFRATEIKLEL